MVLIIRWILSTQDFHYFNTQWGTLPSELFAFSQTPVQQLGLQPLRAGAFHPMPVPPQTLACGSSLKYHWGSLLSQIGGLSAPCWAPQPVLSLHWLCLEGQRCQMSPVPESQAPWQWAGAQQTHIEFNQIWLASSQINPTRLGLNDDGRVNKEP